MTQSQTLGGALQGFFPAAVLAPHPQVIVAITLMTAGARAPHVVIVGGGIAGLAAAVRLAMANRPLRVTLLEAADRVGGLIASERVEGFVIEHGPDAMLAAKPAAAELAQRVGIADSLIGTSAAARGSYIVSRGRLVRLPDGAWGLVPSRLGALLSTPLLSPGGKLRVAIGSLVRRRPASDEESIAAFVVRRLGRETYERIAEPMLTGIFAGDGARLSLDATFPHLREVERQRGGMLRGMVAERRAASDASVPLAPGGGAGKSAFLSFRTGMAELPQAAEDWLLGRTGAAVACTLQLRSPAVALWREGARVCVAVPNGPALDADALVLATPAAVSARLLALHDPRMASLLGGIEHASTAAVSLGYPLGCVGHPLDATGYTVPRIEGRAAIACTWSSAKFAGRAPEHFALFRLFFGGVGRDEVLTRDDADLIALARAELAEMVAVRGAPAIARVTHWPDAMPQYTVGHLHRRAEIEARLNAMPWLALAGNALHGVGIPDCVRSGERAAERILSSLGVAAAHD